MLSYIKSGIISGIIVFIWGAFSWMVIPWHMATLHSFSDEAKVTQIITANAPQSGIYLIPMQQKVMSQEQIVKPIIFSSVNLEGKPVSMVKSMLIGLAVSIIAAILIAWLLSKTSGLSYFSRVGFVVVFALTAGIFTHGEYWNWFAFDSKFIAIEMADLLIGWFLAGLVLAKFSHR